jgi:hypothetical protein
MSELENHQPGVTGKLGPYTDEELSEATPVGRPCPVCGDPIAFEVFPHIECGRTEEEYERDQGDIEAQQQEAEATEAAINFLTDAIEYLRGREGNPPDARAALFAAHQAIEEIEKVRD